MPATVLAASNGKANGVFIDGAHLKGFKSLTEQETQDWNDVILLDKYQLSEMIIF